MEEDAAAFHRLRRELADAVAEPTEEVDLRALLLGAKPLKRPRRRIAGAS
jgi:hypothetical protein